MPATIRLKRMGRKKQSSFRIVVAEKSSAISGPAIENLGIYQPRTEPSLVRLDAERALRWLRNGAMPSDTVKSIFRKTGLWSKYHEGVTPEELTEKEIRLGPPEGELQTSGRARSAAAARERAGEGAETVAPGRDGAGAEQETGDAPAEGGGEAPAGETSSPEEDEEEETGDAGEVEASVDEEPGAGDAEEIEATDEEEEAGEEDEER